MRRAELLLACLVAGVVLGGCMRIYPDPELPDVVAEWYADDCRPETGDVMLSLVGVDTPTFRSDLTVPCTDLKAAFKDVARERYRLLGTLLDVDGGTFSTTFADLDLRNGLDERPSLYFGGFSNFRVGWMFDMGQTCASAGTNEVLIDLVPQDGMGFDFVTGIPCELSPYLGNVPPGMYSLGLRAVAGMQTVASAELASIVIDFDTLTDAGTLVLTPCGASCP